MRTNTLITFIALFSCLFLAVSCGEHKTSFIPMPVPNTTGVRPMEEKVDEKNIQEELLVLHNITLPQYIIMPNDSFSLVVDGHERFCREKLLVMPDGSITVAPIGTVNLSGLTIDQANTLLNEKYAKFLREVDVALEPLQVKGYSFTVDGKISSPGAYPIHGKLRLSDAIALAGGLVSENFDDHHVILSDLKSAYIVRDGSILPVDLDKAIAKGEQIHNIPLQNGDFIYIPSIETSKITILGEVGSPTTMLYRPELTVMQALGYAKGIKETHNQEVKVIRGGLKDPIVYTFNIKDMMSGKTMDFALEPKDIVYIPRNGMSDWNVIVREILPTFQLLNGMLGPFGSPLFYRID